MAERGVSRREFLAEATAALSVATLGPAAWGQGSSTISENSVSVQKNGKKVIIIGAGLSGLMSACELLDRGFEVTILEKGVRAGGKLMSWREKGFGKSPEHAYPLEHGTHVIPRFYNNFREFMGRHGVQLRKKRTNEPYSILSLAYPDGVIDDRPVLNLPAPWHIVAFLRNIKKLTPEENSQYHSFKYFKLFAFDPKNRESISYLDSITMRQWMEKHGFSQGLIRHVMDPILEMSNFKTSNESSALLWHRYVSSMFGSYEDMVGYQFFEDSTTESVIEPLRQAVLAKGGKIVFLTEAAEFLRASGSTGKITSVRSRPIPKGAFVCPICGEVHFYACIQCKRCGYRGGEFVKVEEEVPAQEFVADYFLLAVDPLNAKKLFFQAPFAEDLFFKKTEKLPLGCVAIAYLWYPHEGGSAWEGHFKDREALFCSGFDYLSTTMNHRFLKPRSFGAAGADIVETQIGRGERCAAMKDEEVAEAVDRDLRKVIPSLPRFADYRVMRWDHFSTMTVGAEAARPSVVTPIPNFFVLGDYVFLEENAIFMERVTVAVRLAVNRILEQERLPGRIRILPRETPNLTISLLRKLVQL